MASVSLRHLYKVYSGGVKAVSDFNLEIEDKEFIVLVGPSGCGKSTTLRMIAGLEEITDGELYIDGRLVNDVEPKDRDIAMVFQNYALYPHMTVYDNMAFGLRLRKMPSAEIDARVKEAARILGITELLSRKPKALSGGQRQRVALGRAIVREPKVFLLDEPLSNLDAKLRVQMRTEITKLHNRLATTFIYVTHDQTEAMTMGTRIVVMKDGLVQQVDTPQNLFDRPCNMFVATFIGTPQMNLFNAKLERSGKNLVIKFGSNTIELPESKSKFLTDESYIGKDVILGVRPEDIHNEEIFIASSPKTVITAEVDVVEKLGNETIMYTKVDGKEDYTVARVDARTHAEAGDVIKLAIDANHIHLFDPETELAILGVPHYNYIPAKLTAKDDALVVKFGNNEINLGEGSIKILTEPSLLGGEILIGVKPESSYIATEETDDYVMECEVDFVEDADIYKNVFLKVDGKRGLFATKAASDVVTSGKDKVKLAIKTNEIVLFDPATGSRVSSVLGVSQYNELEGELNVVVKAHKTYTLTVEGKKVTYPEYVKIDESATSGKVVVKIDPKKVVYTKAQVAAAKNVFKGIVRAVDNTGTEAIVLLQLEGSQKPFYARVSPDFNALEGSKIKVGVKSEDFELFDENGKSLIVK
ncbi:MAG TPA: sn-glycerol-3-phosphate ABC transporter ATP-binding protein UgpC [Clostridiales bacterium]|nr:sn-glycerol-3-phosphate ABC transporter ATP-binding protein UgpC [Clostridiales bacterium]